MADRCSGAVATTAKGGGAARRQEAVRRGCRAGNAAEKEHAHAEVKRNSRPRASQGEHPARCVTAILTDTLPLNWQQQAAAVAPQQQQQQHAVCM